MLYTLGIEIAGSQTRAGLLEKTYVPNAAVPYDPQSVFTAILGLEWDENDLGRGALNSEAQIDKAEEITRKILEKAKIPPQEIEGIGVAVIPAIDSRSLRMIPPNERLGIANPVEFVRPLQSRLRQIVGQNLKIEVLNRSQFGAWGEINFGEGQYRNVSNLVYLTISYYIDAGIVINRELYKGSRGLAGQFAHIIVAPGVQQRCEYCGAAGCLWVMASGVAMLQGIKDRFEHGGTGVIDRMIQQYSEEELLKLDRGGIIRVKSPIADKQIFARAIVDAAEVLNDAFARGVVEEAGAFIGRGIAQIINALNPDLIVLGGIAAYSDVLAEAARKEASQLTLSAAYRECRIERSQSGDMAALLGAAISARTDRKI